MSLRSILVFCVFIKLCCGGDDDVKVYDTYTGSVATEEQIAFYTSVNQTEICLTNVKPCNKDDWRRMDGTCNNLKYPSRSSRYNPMFRILPAHFSEGNKPRKARSGKALSTPRKVRNHLLELCMSIHPDLTLAFAGYAEFMFSETNSLHDITNYMMTHTYCCEPEHVNDDICAPFFIENDDPIHRFNDIRCMNLTRPLTYQDYSCTTDAVPSPISHSTQSYDLSHIYNNNGQGEEAMRSYIDGKLIVEEINGQIWPQTGPTTTCFQNNPDETACFKDHTNGLLTTQMLSMWYMRHHNYICSKLRAINPCWTDEEIWQVARDINIAFSQQLYFYEWLPCMIDYDHLVEIGLLGRGPGHRDVYDENLYPTVSLEYAYAQRWLHLIQKSKVKMFDAEGHYVKDFPLVNLTFRPGYLAKENHLEECTQCIFRQPTADFEHCVDYDIADLGVGATHRSFDITTADLVKGRLFGIAPYVDYLYYFLGIKVTSCEDLVKHKIMAPEKVELVKVVYEDCRDLDLIAGMWLENRMEHSNVALTFGHIVKNYLKRAIRSDRFWFESSNRPHPFTKAQLREIRKASIASLMCAVADKVTVIQPNAFRNISPKNPLTSCENIAQIDFSKWADRRCARK